ncbi:MAG TPA: patatin-like phospholipase family protein [Actinomycetota bacterium]|nr:patatin-like phospholipase family protein [Actinomycetota bacterium]
MDRPGAPSRAQWLRRLGSRRRDRVAIVLSGGGPLGALQVGALKAIFEKAIVPDIVVGTSVGSLNAAYLAFDPTPEGVLAMERHWRNFTENDLFPGGRYRAAWARMFVRGNKMFENTGLRRVIERELGADTQIEDAEVPLAIVATDLETGAERVLTSGPLTPALLASAAMPGVYPPVDIDGRLYTDGGVSNNVPIAPAVNLGATTLYVLNSTSHTNQRRPLVRPMDYFFHGFTLARAQRLTIDMRLYAEKVNLVMIPTPPLDFFVPFASMEHTAKLIDLAYEHTRRFLAGDLPLAEGGVQPSLEVGTPGK